MLRAGPALAVECEGNPDAAELSFLDRACSRLVDTWKRGRHEILLSGFAWHLPFTWTAERRAELNQAAWGGGYARTVEEPGGNTHTVFGLAFLDSHKNVEFQIGYAWSAFWGPRDGVQPGLGYAAMIVQRPDIWNGVPFPAVLPVFSLRYDKVTVVSTYIPTIGGGVNHGSVLYVFGQVWLD
jgi:palmitoyl transferase